MHSSETVEITGHLMDTGILSRVLDDIREYEGDYVIDRFDVGHDAHDTSHAVITVSAEDDDALQRLLMRLQTRGVNQVEPGESHVSPAEMDGVFPDNYSTTNLETKVRLAGKWVKVDNPEMDCGLIVDDSGEKVRIYTLPMADVKAGMKVVCGADGIKVTIPLQESGAGRSGSWSPTCPARSRRRCWCARSPRACARPRHRARRCSGSAGRVWSTPARRRRWWPS